MLSPCFLSPCFLWVLLENTDVFFWRTPPCTRGEHGGSHLPLGRCLGRVAFEAQPVGGRLVPLLRAAVAGSENDPFRREALDGSRGSGLGNAGAVVKDAAVAGPDPLDQLLEADVVTVLLEAIGATDDIEQDAQLGLRQLGREHVKQHVGDRRRVRAIKAIEAESGYCGWIASLGHKSTPRIRGIVIYSRPKILCIVPYARAGRGVRVSRSRFPPPHG